MQTFAKSGLRLNVGSGQRRFGAGWINVDCQEKWQPDVIASGEYMPMFETGSADYVVLHHVLEHFGCGESKDLLMECRRVLRHGGSLLVFVPNMRRLAEMWGQGRLTDQVYFTNVYGAYMSDEADRHKWGFVDRTLYTTLRNCDFRTVINFDWRDIPGADIARDTWILGMEAVK